MVVKNGKVLDYGEYSISLRGKDTMQYRHQLQSNFGILKKNNSADIAWAHSSPDYKYPYALEYPVKWYKDSTKVFTREMALKMQPSAENKHDLDALHPEFYKKWKVKTAIGGGPVLVQNGRAFITNIDEGKFSGKEGLTEKHPRTLIGYTAKNELVIMAIQGRYPNVAHGASLQQCAQLMIEVGCIEAMNLDGGGSSCMLINGKNTIQPSDKNGIQRPVPAVFVIKQKK